MRQAARGHAGPASTPATQTELDRELFLLEKRKLVALAGGSITLTRAGYAELVRRGLARNGRSRRRA